MPKALEVKKHDLALPADKAVGDMWVNMSNALARASHSLSLSEKRIISAALGQTDSLPAKSLMLGQNQGWKVKLTASDYATTFDVSMDTAYDQLKSASDVLFERYIRLVDKTPRGPKERKFRWVSGVTYHHGEGWVELNFTPEVAPHVLALRRNFTTYKLKQAAAYRSIFTWRLMECFMSWTDSKKHPAGVMCGRYSPDIEEFQKAMDAPESCLTDYAQLRRRVIEPAVKELREKGNLLIEWEPERKGRKVTKLHFVFKPNPQQSLL